MGKQAETISKNEVFQSVPLMHVKAYLFILKTKSLRDRACARDGGQGKSKVRTHFGLSCK